MSHDNLNGNIFWPLKPCISQGTTPKGRGQLHPEHWLWVDPDAHPAGSRCGCPHPRTNSSWTLGTPETLQTPSPRLPEPTRCRTFLVSIFAFGYALHGLFGERCLSGLRRQRQNINWWIKRRRGWSIWHRVQWWSQTAGKKGWKFWLLKWAPSSDPCKGLGYLEGLGAWPDRLGGHRSCHQLVKALIKQSTRQTRAEGWGREKGNFFELHLLPGTISSALHKITGSRRFQ